MRAYAFHNRFELQSSDDHFVLTVNRDHSIFTDNPDYIKYCRCGDLMIR